MVRTGSVIGFAAGYAAGARWGGKPYEIVRRRLRRGSGEEETDGAPRRPSDVREVMTASPLNVSSDGGRSAMAMAGATSVSRLTRTMTKA